MFNDIEWLCFLINEKFISDRKILTQLEPTLIGYYEDTFLKYVSKDEKVTKRYPEFIKLYQAIKKQSRTSPIWLPQFPNEILELNASEPIVFQEGSKNQQTCTERNDQVILVVPRETGEDFKLFKDVHTTYQ
jgi:hypothetical protein